MSPRVRVLPDVTIEVLPMLHGPGGSAKSTLRVYLSLFNLKHLTV